jgi:hypothetical protein
MEMNKKQYTKAVSKMTSDTAFRYSINPRLKAVSWNRTESPAEAKAS